jgi:hypothetical protein
MTERADRFVVMVRIEGAGDAQQVISRHCNTSLPTDYLLAMQLSLSARA